MLDLNIMNSKKEMFSLIIVDMQKDFTLPLAPAYISGADQIVFKIEKILNFFRNKNWPVFHVVREHRPDGSDVEVTRLSRFLTEGKVTVTGTAGCEIVNELKPVSGEYRIVKKRFSAFMNTELDFMLRRLAIDHIVVCGNQFPSCVRVTVFDGVSYGYTVSLLTDATSAKSAEIAKANIRDIEDIGVSCLTVSDFIEKFVEH